MGVSVCTEITGQFVTLEYRLPVSKSEYKQSRSELKKGPVKWPQELHEIYRFT